MCVYQRPQWVLPGAMPWLVPRLRPMSARRWWAQLFREPGSRPWGRRGDL